MYSDFQHAHAGEAKQTSPNRESTSEYSRLDSRWLDNPHRARQGRRRCFRIIPAVAAETCRAPLVLVMRWQRRFLLQLVPGPRPVDGKHHCHELLVLRLDRQDPVLVVQRLGLGPGMTHPLRTGAGLARRVRPAATERKLTNAGPALTVSASD